MDSVKLDKYTYDVLHSRFNSYKQSEIDISNIIRETGLPLRHQNPPEDITENIVKFLIHNYDNDPSCKWAKSIGCKGDLYSDNYSIESPPEVKAFTSNGPLSFGPIKKFGIIYFLDMRNWLNDIFILWKVNVTNESNEWKQIRMNKTQTFEDQCKEGRRPHICWNYIYEQIPDKCMKIYEGTFDGIFTPRVMESNV